MEGLVFWVMLSNIFRDAPFEATVNSENARIQMEGAFPNPIAIG